MKELKNLSYDELKLFLIMCGEDAKYYVFSPNQIPHDKLVKMYKKLNDLEFIELVDVKTIPGYKKNKAAFGIKTTEKGERIHKEIINFIYTQNCIV